MKQSAAKTLGVAALGAAIAAVGAGAANAAPALPDATSALGGLTQTLPVGGAVQALPVAEAAKILPAPDAVSTLPDTRTAQATTTALGGAATAAKPAVAQTLSEALPTKGLPLIGGLLGGLPINGIPLG
ncbi:ATP-binding protein [Streptomyces sp. NPDC002454]